MSSASQASDAASTTGVSSNTQENCARLSWRYAIDAQFIRPTFIATLSALWIAPTSAGANAIKQTSLSYALCYLECVAFSVATAAFFCVMCGIQVNERSWNSYDGNWWSILSCSIVTGLSVIAWWIVSPFPFTLAFDFPKRTEPPSSLRTRFLHLFQPASMTHAMSLYLICVLPALPFSNLSWPIDRDTLSSVAEVGGFIQTVFGSLIVLPYLFSFAKPITSFYQDHVEEKQPADIEMSVLDASEDLSINTVSGTFVAHDNEQTVRCCKSLNDLLIRATPPSLRGIPPSPIYLLTFMFGFSYWAYGFPNFQNFSSLLLFWFQWWDMLFLVTGLSIIELVEYFFGFAYRPVATTIYFHIGWTTLLGFIYIRWPRSMGIFLIRFYQIYQDPQTAAIIKVGMSTALHVVSTVMQYPLRMIAQRAVPPQSAIAFVFGWQFFESILLDLAFIDLSVNGGYFYLVGFLQAAKSIIRDLDLFAYAIVRIQEWLIVITTKKTSQAQQELSLKTRSLRWFGQYHSFVMRHQNFISESCSKAAIVTVLLFDLGMLGDNAISTTYYKAVATPGYDASYRGELIGGMLFLFTIQIFAHVTMLYIFWRIRLQHSTAFNVMKQNDVNSLMSATRMTSVSDANDDTDMESAQQKKMAYVNDAYLNIQSYWGDHRWLYMSCILTFFYSSFITTTSTLYCPQVEFFCG